MSLHQLIYTSCRRGIEGTNDGQQVYSYDAGFPRELVDQIKGRISYHGPDLPLGVPMSEDLVPTFPQSFTYAPLGGLGDFALTTYLGKDYMGPTGRFGNFLAHHVLGNPSRRPAELIHSPTFRASMDFAEVNNPDLPAHLPQLEAVKPGPVNRESVQQFLALPGNWQLFTKILAALMAGGMNGKRLVINDEPAHVAQWIGALCYAIPLRCAECLRFSTYEYAPIRGDWDVVGAIAEGTKFDPAAPEAYTVDVEAGLVPADDLLPELADFLEVGLLMVPESLEEFHDYLDREYPFYSRVDDTYGGALVVYQLEAGAHNAESVEAGCWFLSRHANRQQKESFLGQVLSSPLGIELLSDASARPTLLEFINSTATDGLDLLQLTFDADGHLRDIPNSDKEIQVLWDNLYREIVAVHPQDQGRVMRELADYRRIPEMLGLFATFLHGGGARSATSLFGETMALLPSPHNYPPFIDAYYKFADSAEDRMELLDFVIANRISFNAAETLVAEALATMPFDFPTNESQEFIVNVWTWARSCGLKLDTCGRLFHLYVGIVLTERLREDLDDDVRALASIAASAGIQAVPDDDSFIDWVGHKLITKTKSGAHLYETMATLGLRPEGLLLKIFEGAAVRRFDLSTWLKIAECIYSSRSRTALASFAQACKSLSNRDIATIQATAVQRYANHPTYMRAWQEVYDATQTTALRSMKNWLGKIGKKGEERDRKER